MSRRFYDRSLLLISTRRHSKRPPTSKYRRSCDTLASEQRSRQRDRTCDSRDQHRFVLSGVAEGHPTHIVSVAASTRRKDAELRQPLHSYSRRLSRVWSCLRMFHTPPGSRRSEHPPPVESNAPPIFKERFPSVRRVYVTRPPFVTFGPQWHGLSVRGARPRLKPRAMYHSVLRTWIRTSASAD